MINITHDAALRSWVESANASDTDFPVQNLPLGVFARSDRPGEERQGVAIGDSILDLAESAVRHLLPGFGEGAFHGPLNALMAREPEVWRHLRQVVSVALRADTPEGARTQAAAAHVLLDRRAARLTLPARIGDYTDFYASVYHATNIGSMFRPENPLLPNYQWIPIGYHGRASSIVASGIPVRRPMGQTAANPAGPPTFGPCRRLDYEVELGAWIGGTNTLGVATAIAAAGERVFGVSLLNDWSARDVQAWEYQPLGPFLAKNFASTVSPWIVTAEALAPFRTAAFGRAPGDPAPLPYLTDPEDQRFGGIDLGMEAWIRTARMREAGEPAVRLSTSNTRDLYWTFAQIIAHHTSGGCNLQPGDLLGSGTVSGAEKGSRGCLQELAWRGTEPVTLPNGETRAFLEDGDELTLRARATRDGFRSIGLGECSGIVLPASA